MEIFFFFRVIKPHSSICLHLFWHFRWTSEGHPKCRDVLVMCIVTYAWWFQEPNHTHMLCLRWSTSISYVAPCCMLHQCVTCWDNISTLPRDWYAPLLNSSRLTAQLYCAKFCRCCHSLQRMTFSGKLLFVFRDLWKAWGDSNFQIFSQDCQFHHMRLESLEHFNVHLYIILSTVSFFRGYHIIFTGLFFHFVYISIFFASTLHVCYVFNVIWQLLLMTDGLNVVWSNERAAPTDTNPKNLELAPPQSVTPPNAGKSTSRTGLRKHSLFKRLSAGIWPCREWAAFVSCFFFSTLAHTSLLMSGGAIPASRYRSSTLLVGLKHPVIDLHASFSSGSSLEACEDLSQTGHAYSATEVRQRQCCCSNSACVATPFGVW